MAEEKRLYKKQGIDLTILRGGPEFPPSETIARGKVTFTSTFLTSALELRNRGVRLVNIGQLVQRSGFIPITKKASGINSPADLNGKKDGIYCLEETVRQNVDLCRGFIRASPEGWEYAFANPVETLDVVM